MCMGAKEFQFARHTLLQYSYIIATGPSQFHIGLEKLNYSVHPVAKLFSLCGTDVLQGCNPYFAPCEAYCSWGEGGERKVWDEYY